MTTADTAPPPLTSVEPQCLHRLLECAAAQTPEAPAITAPGRAPLTYHGLYEQVCRTVEALNARGIGRDDRVALVLPDGPEMAVAFLAVAAGAAGAPLNPAYQAAEFDFYLGDLKAKALITRAGAASPALDVAAARGIPSLELSPLPHAAAGLFTLAGPAAAPSEARGLAQPDDVALVLHTSGTTARPKIVPLAHRHLCASARHIWTTLELAPGDRCLNVMPLFHIHGLIGAVLASLAAGASVVCTPGFLAPRFFEWMEAFRPTWYTAVPTMHQAILARAPAHAQIRRRCSLRFIRSSSAALPPNVLTELERVFRVPVIEAYGMTEAAHQMASNPLRGRRKPGSVGRAAGPEVAVIDENGRLLSPGAVGEVVVRGPNVFAGYEGSPEANESAFTDGWFRTGDQGYLDEDGYLFLTGRLKELINRGGEKIAPREVEEALLAHPAVAQAVVFAVPDPRLGEEVGAAVVLTPGVQAFGRSGVQEDRSLSEPERLNAQDQRQSTLPSARSSLRAGTRASVPPERLIRELRAFAAERLAPFKVPRRVVLVPEIPKGPTGKVQRIGLAEKLGLMEGVGRQVHPPFGGYPGVGGPSLTPNAQRLTPPMPHAPRSTPFAPPRTPLEEVLAGIWGEVLGLDRVGIHDRFFDRGGDSVLATQLVARVRDALQTELSVISLFEEEATVAEMAARLLREPDQRVRVESTAELLLEIAGLSEDEVEEMLARLEPRA